MTSTPHPKFSFDTVFDNAGDIAYAASRPKRVYTIDEVEVLRSEAFSQGEQQALASMSALQAQALSQIKGAGEVTVMLTVANGPRQVLAQDVDRNSQQGEESTQTVILSRGSSSQETIREYQAFDRCAGRNRRSTLNSNTAATASGTSATMAISPHSGGVFISWEPQTRIATHAAIHSRVRPA